MKKKDRRLESRAASLLLPTNVVVSNRRWLSRPRRGRKYIDTFSTYCRFNFDRFWQSNQDRSCYPSPTSFLNLPSTSPRVCACSRSVFCHGHGTIALLYWLGRVRPRLPGISFFPLYLPETGCGISLPHTFTYDGNCASYTLSRPTLSYYLPTWHCGKLFQFFLLSSVSLTSRDAAHEEGKKEGRSD